MYLLVVEHIGAPEIGSLKRHYGTSVICRPVERTRNQVNLKNWWGSLRGVGVFASGGGAEIRRLKRCYGTSVIRRLIEPSSARSANQKRELVKIAGVCVGVFASSRASQEGRKLGVLSATTVHQFVLRPIETSSASSANQKSSQLVKIAEVCVGVFANGGAFGGPEIWDLKRHHGTSVICRLIEPNQESNQSDTNWWR